MSQPSTGGAAPGLLSPFDIGASGAGEAQSLGAMVNRYHQLGLGGFGATPTSPGGFGLGGTAMQMDVGALPSLTGGIPAEFEAGLGQAQTQDLSSTLALALNNLNTGTTNKSNLLTGLNSPSLGNTLRNIFG